MIASDVMHPQPGEDDLVILYRDSMEIQEIEKIMNEYSYNGYPVIANENMSVIGYVTRTELKAALGKAKAFAL